MSEHLVDLSNQLPDMIEDTGLLIFGKVSEEGYMYLTWSTDPKVIIGK